MDRIKSLFLALRRETRGATLVEFAIALPLLIASILGVAEVGHKIHSRAELDAAAQFGLRYAQINKFDVSEISTKVINASSLQDIQASPIPRTFCGCAKTDGSITQISCGQVCSSGDDPATYTEVSARLDYEPIFSLPGISEGTQMTAVAQARTE